MDIDVTDGLNWLYIVCIYLVFQLIAKMTFLCISCIVPGLLWVMLGVFGDWKYWRPVGDQEEEIDISLGTRLDIV